MAVETFPAGSIVGSYEIVRRLGEGGMGEVYQARHRHIGRDAAIKILRAELSTDAGVVKRFFTEARATAAMHHPGIVEILDCDVHGSGRAYIVMELLSGENLGQRLARVGGGVGELPLILSVTRQIASALAVAHGRGIVHRDLKPENIFLVAGCAPLVKILDFGVAKLLNDDGDAGAKTRAGTVLGTPTYMAPEQCRGAPTVDHRADIYALGCVMFEMLAGRPPFVRDTPGQVLVAHITQEPPRVASLVPGIPAVLDDLVAEMLAKDPDARPPTMNHVVARLEILGETGEGPSPGRVATQPMPVDELVALAPRLAAPNRFVVGETQVMPRISNTTLGDSASAVETAEPATPARPRWLVPVAASAALVVVVVGVVALTRPSAIETSLAARPVAASQEPPVERPAATVAPSPAVAAPPSRAVVLPPSPAVAPPPSPAVAPPPLPRPPPERSKPRVAESAAPPAATPSKPARAEVPRHHHHKRKPDDDEFKAIGD